MSCSTSCEQRHQCASAGETLCWMSSWCRHSISESSLGRSNQTKASCVACKDWRSGRFGFWRSLWHDAKSLLFKSSSIVESNAFYRGMLWQPCAFDPQAELLPNLPLDECTKLPKLYKCPVWALPPRYITKIKRMCLPDENVGVSNAFFIISHDSLHSQRSFSLKLSPNAIPHTRTFVV
jgi:hypothetical protein